MEFKGEGGERGAREARCFFWGSKQPKGLSIVESCGLENASGMLKHRSPSSPSQCSDVKVLHQVWPNCKLEFSGSMDLLCTKRDENNMGAGASREFHSNFENSELLHDDYDDDVEFTVTERGVKLDWIIEEKLDLTQSAAGKMDWPTVEAMHAAVIFKDEVNISDKELNLDPLTEGFDESLAGHFLCKDSCSCEMELTRDDREPNICNLLITKSVDSESLAVGGEEICDSVKSIHRMSKTVKSLTLDVFMKAVEDDFINLLGEKDDPCNSSDSSDDESPKEPLWREFENDVMASENFLFDSDTPEDDAEFCCLGPASCSDIKNEDTIQLAAVHTPTLDLTGKHSTRHKSKPEMLQGLETQSLVQRYGFSNEQALESSPDSCSGGFGSPIYGAPDEPGRIATSSFNLALETSCSEELLQRLESSEDEAYVKLKAWGSSSTLNGNGFRLT